MSEGHAGSGSHRAGSPIRPASGNHGVDVRPGEHERGPIRRWPGADITARLTAPLAGGPSGAGRAAGSRGGPVGAGRAHRHATESDDLDRPVRTHGLAASTRRRVGQAFGVLARSPLLGGPSRAAGRGPSSPGPGRWMRSTSTTRALVGWPIITTWDGRAASANWSLTGPDEGAGASGGRPGPSHPHRASVCDVPRPPSVGFPHPVWKDDGFPSVLLTP
jgi:hypothetical protein